MRGVQASHDVDCDLWEREYDAGDRVLVLVRDAAAAYAAGLSLSSGRLGDPTVRSATLTDGVELEWEERTIVHDGLRTTITGRFSAYGYATGVIEALDDDGGFMTEDQPIHLWGTGSYTSRFRLADDDPDAPVIIDGDSIDGVVWGADVL